MGEQFKRWKAALLAHLFGTMPAPDVAEAVRQQRAVTDTHSVKVDARAEFAACFAASEVEAAAGWLIMATRIGEGVES